MRIAIMQPYIFPYIGYFQLIKSVDKFVFYDDVNFIKKGWINRNRIIVNGMINYFTIPLKSASQNKIIKEIEYLDVKKIIKKIDQAYKKAPFYKEVMPIIERCLLSDSFYISDLAAKSVICVSEYLDISIPFYFSSLINPDNNGKSRVERLVNICNLCDSKIYINNYSGNTLYTKEDFAEYGIDLHFLKPKIFKYRQFNSEFESGLSIIDVVMFNEKELIQYYLKQYTLV